MSLSPPAAWRKWFRRLRPARRARAQARPTFRPGLDFVLEERLAPATRLWTGAGADGNWSTGPNWAGGVAPVGGDDRVFPSGARQMAASNNDLTAGTPFNSVSVYASGYTFTGNAIALGAGGLTVGSAAGGTDTFNVGLALSTSASITNTYAGVTLRLSSVDTS